MSDSTTATTIDELRAALAASDVSLRLERTFTHGRCVQVYVGRRKASPVIIPSDGQTLADVLHMLGTLADEDGVSA